MTHDPAAVDPIWQRVARPLPQWYATTPFGIFIHWGAYSVPAWAEPIGALGTFDSHYWMAHNPYAEWYANTIQIDGSEAQKRHQEVYGGAPYDDFLDQWKAENFDATALTRLFASAGAGYVVPTTKHHDGITLWDAPETGERNTVHRGPKRDLIAEFADATRENGMKFGVYYSGGLDWHVRPMRTLTGEAFDDGGRPNDAAYGAYCARHVRDLIDKYQPSLIFNDINWPDESKDFSPDGVGTLFEYYYEHVPEGVVDDRWGEGVHFDYLSSEYESGRDREERGVPWEQTRGLGWSFGYNQEETAEHTMSGRDVARLLVDIVSRGGHLLLNVGPKADGTLPPVQEEALRTLARWMPDARNVLYGHRATPTHTVEPVGDAWVRVVASENGEAAFIDHDTAREVEVTVDGLPVTVALPADRPGPVVLPL